MRSAVRTRDWMNILAREAEVNPRSVNANMERGKGLISLWDFGVQYVVRMMYL